MASDSTNRFLLAVNSWDGSTDILLSTCLTGWEAPNGGGSIFTFDIKGGQEEAFKFIDSLKIFSLLANVADVKSLVVHPYTTTHSELTPEELAAAGISPATIRLSIGTEHYEDIINDLDQALNNI